MFIQQCDFCCYECFLEKHKNERSTKQNNKHSVLSALQTNVGSFQTKQSTLGFPGCILHIWGLLCLLYICLSTSASSFNSFPPVLLKCVGFFLSIVSLVLSIEWLSCFLFRFIQIHKNYSFLKFLIEMFPILLSF